MRDVLTDLLTPADYERVMNSDISFLEALQAAARLGAERERATMDAALDLLETMYRLWENGTECYEDPEECAGLLGNAVWLDDITERKIADLLNEHRPAKSPFDEIDQARGGGDA